MDLFVFSGILIFITGGFFLIPNSLENLIMQKPILHRLSVTGYCLATFFGYWLYTQTFTPDKSASLYSMHLMKTILSHPGCSVSILFVHAALIWTISSLIRHETFHSGFDTAIFAQAVWNTTNGNFLYSSIKGGICLLGDHFSPLLAVFALPYSIWPDAKCLLFLQATLTASSVFPIYLFAKRKLSHTGFALLFTTALTCYLPLINSVRFEFHPEICAIVLFFWGFYFLDKHNFLIASIIFIPALLSKENAALSTLMIGVYALFLKTGKLFGFFWIIFSAVYFYLSITLWIPSISGKEYFYLSGNFLAWKDLGPSAIFQQLFSPASFSYLIKIFAPLGFTSFLDFPSVFLTLPGIAQNLTARNEAVRSIFFQYTAFLTPFVFISSILGARRACAKPIFALYLIFCVLCMSGVSEYFVIQRGMKRYEPRFSTLKRYMRSIPSDASVRTHEFFAPHLANRRNLHIFENNHPDEGGSQGALSSEYVILDLAFLGAEADKKISELLTQGYNVDLKDGGFLILKRQDLS